MKTLRRLLQLTFTLSASCCLALSPALAAEKSQLIKAAFIYNFTKFVQWPEAITAPTPQITICILGPNSLGDATSVFDKASSAALAIHTQFVSQLPNTPGSCQIIYVDASYGGYMNEISRQAAAISALTVSDMPGFVDKGGMIGFVNTNNKIRLHINHPVTMAAGLKLDAQLLEIASKVVR